MTIGRIGVDPRNAAAGSMLMTRRGLHATRSATSDHPDQDQMATVQIRAVEKYFGAAHIIRGVDIDIEDGQFASSSVPRAAASPPCCA
jgi:hypothetical protein